MCEWRDTQWTFIWDNIFTLVNTLVCGFDNGLNDIAISRLEKEDVDINLALA